MRERRTGRGLVEREPILLGFQNVLDGAKAIGAQPLGAVTRRLQAIGAMLAAEPHETETGAIALFRMRPPLEQAGDKPAGRGAGLLGPARSGGTGVHSACARCACGMCSTSVANWPRPVRRACDATRRPFEKTSMVLAVARASTCACTSGYGTL